MTEQLTVQLRPELREFIEALELRLREHDRRNRELDEILGLKSEAMENDMIKGDSWKEFDEWAILKRIAQEFAECLESGNPTEYLDLCAFCFMGWWNKTHKTEEKK